MPTDSRTYKGMSSKRHYTHADKVKMHKLHMEGVETCFIADRFGCHRSLVTEYINQIKGEKGK